MTDVKYICHALKTRNYNDRKYTDMFFKLNSIQPFLQIILLDFSKVFLLLIMFKCSLMFEPVGIIIIVQFIFSSTI